MSNLDTTAQPPAAHAAGGLAVLFSAAAALGGFLFGFLLFGLFDPRD